MPRRFLKYRLRTLLLLIAVVAAVLGPWRRMRQHEEARQSLAKADDVAPPLDEPSWTDRISHRDLYKIERISYHGVRDAGDADLAGLRHFPRLKRLSLHRTAVTDEGLRHVAPLKNLRALSLNHTEVTDAGLAHLAGLHKLELLQLNFTQVQGGGMKHLSEMHELRKLELKGIPLEDKDLVHIRGAVHMRELSLSRPKIRGSSLSILENFKELEQFTIYVGDELQEIEIRALPKLEKLSIVGGHRHDCRLILDDLPACTYLRVSLWPEVGARMPEVGARMLEAKISRVPNIPHLSVPLARTIHLRQLTKLESLRLRLSRCESLLLDDLPAVRRLWTENTGVSDACMEQVGKLRTLEEIHMDRTQVQDESLRHLRNLGRLERLDLWGTPINGNGLVHLAKLRNLRRLRLGMTQVNDEGLAHLSNLTQLELLNLYRAPVTGEGLSHLSNLRNLKELTLQSTAIQGPALVHLRDLTELEVLLLGGVTDVTDDDLVHLQRMQKLERLSLAATTITDACVPHLAKLRSLESINMHNTQVSEDAIRRLSQALPNGHASK